MTTTKFYILLLLLCLSPAAMTQSVTGEQSMDEIAQQTNLRLLVTVVDENSVPVNSAQVVLTRTENKAVLRGETDYAGRREFTGLSAGHYQLQVEKPGFFATSSKSIQIGANESFEVVLSHEHELRESL